MPSCKIFLEADRDVSHLDLETINDIIIDDLQAQGEHTVVVVVPSARVNLSGCYVELTCRHKANRTPELRLRLAERLDKAARKIFSIDEPVRVRIVMVEESELAGVN